VAHRSVTTLYTRPHPPPESRRCHARSIAIVTCRRCCRVVSPAHGASGHLVPPHTVEMSPLPHQHARGHATTPPWCTGMSLSMTCCAPHITAGLSCHMSCVRRLATESSTRVRVGHLHIYHLANVASPSTSARTAASRKSRVASCLSHLSLLQPCQCLPWLQSARACTRRGNRALSHLALTHATHAHFASHSAAIKGPLLASCPPPSSSHCPLR
jgi:hypothetical protein